MIHSSFWEFCCLAGALFLASNLWFYIRVLRPIQKLSHQASLLSQGEFNSFDRQCGGISEIRELRRAMSGMVGHVRRAQEQSRAYAEQLADGQENERKRVARELHDDAVQSTIAITQGIDMAKNWLKTDPDRAIQMLQLVREQGVEIVNSLRNLIGDLRPPALEELGLIPALAMQITMMPSAKIKLSTHGEARRLEEAQELTLFRATQEALRNITRHTQAKHIHVDVDYQSQGVSLQIQDDGCGFNPPQQLGDLAFQHHYGLLGVQERVISLDGRFKIDSQIGKGTTLHIYLPTVAHNQPGDRVCDPVCSALIEPHQAYASVLYEDETHYFCCPVCQGAFQKDPVLYLNKAQQNAIAAQ
jgi:signal transduction histidine kinase/YHS domain-containing protein